MKAVPADTECLAKAQARFAGGAGVKSACFPGVEAHGGCMPARDVSTLADDIDEFVAATVADLDGTQGDAAASKCAAAKERCVSKLTVALLRCYATAERKGVAVGDACMAKADAAFDGGAKPERACFARLEKRGTCAATDDPSATEARVDAFVQDIACGILPSDPTCMEPTPPAEPTPTVAATGPTPTGVTPTPARTPTATRPGRTPTPARTPTSSATRTGGTPGRTRTPTPAATPPPAVCGNGIVEVDEEDCDGTNLDGFTCDDFCIGATGTLRCTSDCFFDVSGCTGFGCEPP